MSDDDNDDDDNNDDDVNKTYLTTFRKYIKN